MKIIKNHTLKWWYNGVYNVKIIVSCLYLRDLNTVTLESNKNVGVVLNSHHDDQFKQYSNTLRDISYNVWSQCMAKLRNNNFQDLEDHETELRTIKSLDFTGPSAFRYIMNLV